MDWTNEIFLLLFRHLAAIERKKRFGLVKIELVAELIHTKSVAKVLGTNSSRAYEGESDSRLLPGMKELDGRPFPGKRNSSDRKAQLSLSLTRLGLLSFLMLHKPCGIRVVLRTFADIHHQKEERAICQFRTC